MLIVHDPQCASYRAAAHPDRPARVHETAKRLQKEHPNWTWQLPAAEAHDELLLLAHTREHLDRIKEPKAFDADTPYVPGIDGHARRSVTAAVEVAHHALGWQTPAFSLMRPPGHHATAGLAMGFCYLNSVAIASLEARRSMGAVRVAVWDFDAHHGNGTEELLKGKQGFLFCSVHQYPCYPGTGASDQGNCRNWPVLPHASREEHLNALKASWDVVLGFRPDLVLVSAGFDAYKEDPITQMSLEAADFREMGVWLHQSGLACAAVLEGGYSPALPELIDEFLSGWENGS